MTEWKTIPDFPDYQASSDGEIMRVRVDANNHRLTGKPLKQVFGTTGYLQVTLCDHGRTKSCRVNRIVCSVFHGPAPTSDHHAAHNDGDRLNNAADNLRWVDGRENEQDKRRHGTAAIGERHWSKLRPECRAKGTRHGLAKLTDEAVRAIRADTRKQREIARDHGVSQRVVWSIKNRITWSHVA